MEELKLQLGDRLPGVLSIAAKSMGVTNAEFIKMMENGEIAAKEFIPLFIEGMREMAAPGLQRAIHSTAVAQQQMATSWQQMKNALFVSGFGEIFEDIFTLIRDILDVARPWVSLFAGFLAGVLEPILFVFRFIFALIGDITDAIDYFLRKMFDVGIDEVFAKVGYWIGQIVGFFFGGVIAKGIGLLVKAFAKFSGVFRVIGAITDKIAQFFSRIASNPVFQALFGTSKAGVSVNVGGKLTAEGAQKAMNIGTKTGVFTNMFGEDIGGGADKAAEFIKQGLPAHVRVALDLTGKARGMFKEASTTQITRPVQSNIKE